MALLPTHHPSLKAACGRSITHLPPPPPERFHASQAETVRPSPWARHTFALRCSLPPAAGRTWGLHGFFRVLWQIFFLGFAQPRGKYLIYFSRNLSRFCTASRQIAYLFLEKFSFPPHFRWVVGAHGHDRLIRRGVQQSGRNSNSKTKKKRRKKKLVGSNPHPAAYKSGAIPLGHGHHGEA